MAGAIRCKHCGWYETDHQEPGTGLSLKEVTAIKSGYGTSLYCCTGFEPPKRLRKLQLTEENLAEKDEFARNSARDAFD